MVKTLSAATRKSIDFVLKQHIHRFIWHYQKWGSAHWIYFMGKDGNSFASMYWFNDDTNMAMICNLSVYRSRRKRGIGTELQEIREKIAVILGATTVSLHVMKNSWMKQWYERRGYKYHSEYRLKKGNIWMQKKVGNHD